ncbi:Uncharacterized membrane protein [Pseudomonas syringae]|uniref:DUF2269 family protein n=2 Tax=Pseudomonas syringae group TaxID=136849 RepID=A0A3M3MRM4_9PSED|nr:hypothetical protein ALQ58_00237 [Pseudomonas syringae pv. apii]RMN52747.1 hypothetical protein ALQ59_02173 [Pseudomonas syringae pv. apii]RMN90798.1 hypothetical protein ALQ49_02822 [Pseudomonas syringae pv. apii]SDY86167.1 Uncharacterized membrane protein [Pseudomonas syringae]
MLYLYLKYLHVIAAIFLFGFGMGSYLYLIAASRSGNPVVIAHVARMVVRFDTWITTPAGFVQVITGYAMVRLSGMALLTDWIISSLIIFACVGAPWLPVLILQKRLERLADHVCLSSLVLAGCHRFFRHVPYCADDGDQDDADAIFAAVMSSLSCGFSVHSDAEASVPQVASHRKQSR